MARAKEESTSGSVKLKLSRSYDLDGVKKSTLTMREPKVKDVKLAEKSCAGDEAEKDITLMANLCDVPVEFIDELYFKDFKIVRDQLKTFL